MRYLLILLMSSLFIACKDDKHQAAEVIPEELVVGMSKSPDRLNPIIYPTSIAREVYQYIFLPLADYNPETYELEPILIEEIPTAEQIEEGVNKGSISFNMRILDEARWEDGSPITGHDYAFTIKAIKHPLVKAAAYRSYLSSIENVIVNAEDPKSFQVIVDEAYMNDREVACSLPIYPAYIYDPSGALSTIDISTFNAEKEKMDYSEEFKKFAEDFNSLAFSRENVSGAGPYKLLSWENDETIILEAKPDYFGDQLPALSAHTGAQRITFKVIPDETAMVTQLKSGNVDITASVDALAFQGLRDNTAYKDELNFSTPPVFQYFFIGINNKDPKLKEEAVRKALAHVTDVDYLIKALENGNAQRTIGIVNPAKSYYNKKLTPIKYDIAAAQALLTDNGWVDTDDDGIVEKTIDGKKESLDLDLYITGSDLSKAIALNVQEEAKKIGVKINIVTTTLAKLRSEHLNTGKFHLAALAVAQDIGYNDPYNKWHSDNATPEGSNDYGYTSGVADGLIDNIRKSKDIDKRNQYYLKLQEVMYNDQPAIFLYTPSERVIFNKKWNGVITAKRPGYLANTFKYSPVLEGAER